MKSAFAHISLYIYILNYRCMNWLCSPATIFSEANFGRCKQTCQGLTAALTFPFNAVHLHLEVIDYNMDAVCKLSWIQAIPFPSFPRNLVTNTCDPQSRHCILNSHFHGVCPSSALSSVNRCQRPSGRHQRQLRKLAVGRGCERRRGRERWAAGLWSRRHWEPSSLKLEPSISSTVWTPVFEHLSASTVLP